MKRLNALTVLVFTLFMSMMVSAQGVAPIFIKSQDGSINLQIAVDLGDTVANVKKIIESETGIAAERLTLIFAGKELDDDRSLSDYNIQKESTLFVEVGDEALPTSTAVPMLPVPLFLLFIGLLGLFGLRELKK